MADKNKCAMCQRDNVRLSFEPSRKQLIMGSFPNGQIAMEYRCAACERKLCKRIEKMIQNIN